MTSVPFSKSLSRLINVSLDDLEDEDADDDDDEEEDDDDEYVFL